MISKSKAPEVFGLNDDLPEGIFGIIERHVKKKKKAKTSTTEIAKPKKRKAKPSDASATLDSTESSKLADASSASQRPKKKKKTKVEPILIGAAAPMITAPPAESAPKTKKKKRKVVIDAAVIDPKPVEAKPVTKAKKKKKKKQIVIDTPKVDEPVKKRRKKKLKVEPAAIAPPPKRKKTISAQVMPKLEINYESRMPREAEGLKLENVVSIPEDILRSVADKTENRTKALSRLLLNGTAPAMLSYDAASNYVKAVLSDGLKIDVEIDRGVLEVVKDMSRLDVVFFYLKRLSLPQSMKKRFMRNFIDELSKASLETMHKTNKSDTFSSQLRELEAVVYKRSEHQAKESGAKARAAKRIGTTTENGPGMTGTKKTRRDATPLMGGF